MLIYLVRNSFNAKIYVGKTKRSLRHRISCHRWEARSCRSNTLLHKAMRKYGFESFTFEILEYVENSEQLNLREKHYITAFNATSRHTGYNLTNGGDGGPVMPGRLNPQYGVKRPDLSALNRSRKGRRLSLEHRRNISKGSQRNGRKAVFCPELNLTFDSMAAAARHIGGQVGNVCSVVKGRLRNHKGFTFRLIDNSSDAKLLVNEQ